MKILTAIFTQDRNLPYFEKCLEYWDIANQYCKAQTATSSDLLIVDFSSQQSQVVEILAHKYKGRYLHKYGKRGFGSNFNATRHFAIMMGYDYLCLLNDDTAIHEDFLVNAIQLLEDYPEAGFCGGQQTPGSWCLPLESLKINPPDNHIYEMRQLYYLQWEFSAFCCRVQMLKDVGSFEEMLDPTGYLMDSEYLFRAQQKGWKNLHNGNCSFWHAKGISQTQHRDPPRKGIPDPIREKAINLIKNKWGIDVSQPVEALRYSTPYNLGKEHD